MPKQNSMKKVTFTVAQFAILMKAQEQVSFQFDEVDKFIKENKEKEEFPVLEIDQPEFDDMIDSIRQLEEKLEGDEKAEVTKWLEELTEPVAENTETIAEEPVAAADEIPGEKVVEPAAETEASAEETGKE